MGETVPADYFVNLYKRDIDPWHFETSDYEQEKYRATMQALPRERYRNALELACSVGVFTDMLAERCERVLALDVSDEALARARQNCGRHSHVRFERRTLPAEFPPGSYDLVTLCEMGFYLCEDDLHALREKIVAHTAPAATVILVHWTPPVNGHACTAEEVHHLFCSDPRLRALHGFSAPTYRLDVLERRP